MCRSIMSRKRNKQKHPIIGGIVGDDTTKQGRRRRAKCDAKEMTERVRKEIQIPTFEEIRDVERTKA